MILLACDSHGRSPYENLSEPAHFKITTEVVNAGVRPFTATIGGFGNSFINAGSGFEPVVFRTKYVALENSPNRVVAEPSDISHWETLREGALDGAEVQVYRIENGRFSVVRQDRIAEGGFHASGWHAAMRAKTVLPPGQTRFQFRWDGYNRPRVPYYFTVRAIDYSGNLSSAAQAVSVLRPENTGDGEVSNPASDFRVSKLMLDATPPPVPTNLRARVAGDGVLHLEWDEVEVHDLAGYIVYRSDYPPDLQQGYYLQLASQPTSARQHVRAGDLVIISKKFYSPSRNRFHSNRVWGAGNENQLLMPGLVGFYPDEDPRKSWELVPHDAETPVQDPGETFMRLKVANTGPTSLATYNHSGTGQNWYDVLETEPYKVEVWLRHEGKGSVRFKLTGFFDNKPHKVAPIEFRPGTEWRKFTATFTPPVVQPGTQPNEMALEFFGPGTFDVDNFRVYRADAEYLDYTPDEYDELLQSGMRALRTHGFVKTGRRTYDMEQFTNPGGVISGTDKLNTLPQTLAMMRKAGVRPWLQIEPHMSPQELLGLVEYMAAPYDPARDTPQAKPWAHKRYSQGQAKPWVDEFGRIDFELGNETWNQLFRPWVFDDMIDAATGKEYSRGQVYGFFQEHVITTLRSSPYWQDGGLEEKFNFVLGGWTGFAYGAEAAAASPSSNDLTLAAYNGGWDEGEGPPGLNAASFFNVLNQVTQSAIPSAERHAKEVRDLNAKRQAKLRLGTYEAGPGYALNGLNNAEVSKQQASEQEAVMKSLAAGTATLDSFLARAYFGFSTQNFFTFDAGTLWRSHAKWYDGGQAYPSWKLLALFNNRATGDMLATELISVPTAELNAFNRRNAVKNAPLLAVYATRQGRRYSVFVLSRKIPDHPVPGDPGFTSVTLELPFKSARSVTLYKLVGNPRANNIRADNVKIEKVELPADVVRARFVVDGATGADEKGVAPAATFLYVFEDANDEQ